MSDWRQKIEQDEAARQQAQSERKKAFYAELQRKGEQKFKCHICRRASVDGALASSGWTAYTGDDELVRIGQLHTRIIEKHGDVVTSRLLYYKPNDMEICQVCRRVTCREHIHKGVCQRDAEAGRTTPADRPNVDGCQLLFLMSVLTVILTAFQWLYILGHKILRIVSSSK